MKFFTYLAVTALWGLSSLALSAQWTNADLNFLTDNTMDKYVSQQAMVLDEAGQIHLIYQQDNNDLFELWYLRRSAEGKWDAPVQINQQDDSVIDAQIGVWGTDSIFVSYLKKINDLNTLFVRLITPNSEEEFQLTNGEEEVHAPHMSIGEGGVAHFTWVGLNDDEKYKVYYTSTAYWYNELQYAPQVEEMLFSNVGAPELTRPKVAANSKGQPLVAYAGPAGQTNYKIQYIVKQEDNQWYYSPIAQSPNQSDTDLLLKVVEDQVHLVYAGNDGSNNMRVVYTKKPFEGDNNSWDSQVVIADAPDLNPQSLFLDRDGKVHIALIDEDESFLYISNMTGAWISDAVLGGYPIKRTNVVLDHDGNGFLLAEHQTSASEQIILWGPDQVELSGFASLDLVGKLFPNPTNSQFNIQMEEGIKQVEVYSLNGRQVYQANFNHINNLQIDGQDWAKTYYIVKVITEENVYTTKVLLH